MEQSSSSEANSSSASQEIPRILWNPKVHYRIHKSPPPIFILSHTNTVNTPFRSLNINFNIIHLSTRRSSKWSVSIRFPHQILYVPLILSHQCYTTHQSQSLWFDRPNKFWWRLQIIHQALCPRNFPFLWNSDVHCHTHTHTQAPSAGIYSEPKQNLVQFSQPTFKMHLIFSFRLSYSLSSNIRRAQVKVGLINLCKGLFSLNARIYSKTCLKRTPYIPETWTNGK